MTLEEKFIKYFSIPMLVSDPKKQYRNIVAHELTLIAEKYYVGEVLKPALRANKLEKQLEQQKQFTDTNARIALRFKEEIDSQIVIAEGVVSIEKDTTVFIDGLSLETFIDAEICQRVKKYQGKKVKIILEAINES